VVNSTARFTIAAVAVVVIAGGVAGCTSGNPDPIRTSPVSATTTAAATVAGALHVPIPLPGELGRIDYRSSTSQQEIDVHGAAASSGYQVEAACLGATDSTKIGWELTDEDGVIAASTVRCDGEEEIATAIAAGTKVGAAHLTLTGGDRHLKRAYVVLTPAS